MNARANMALREVIAGIHWLAFNKGPNHEDMMTLLDEEEKKADIRTRHTFPDRYLTRDDEGNIYLVDKVEGVKKINLDEAERFEKGEPDEPPTSPLLGDRLK